MDILGFYHELLALIEDNDCEGLKAAKFNRTPGILYKPIEFEFTLDNESYTLEVSKNEKPLITASPARNLSTCMIPITRNRKRIKARNTKPWSG